MPTRTSPNCHSTLSKKLSGSISRAAASVGDGVDAGDPQAALKLADLGAMHGGVDELRSSAADCSQVDHKAKFLCAGATYARTIVYC